MSHDLVNLQMKKTWLNEREVAQHTGLSVHTLRSHRFHRKGIAYSKIGRSIRYSMSDVQTYMLAHRVNLAGSDTQS